MATEADKVKATEFKEKGNTALREGRVDDAINFYCDGLDLDSDNYILFSNRSACWAKKEVWKEALKDAEECVRIAPDWGKGYARLGIALHALGRFEEALEAYDKGIAKDPSLTLLTSNRAITKKRLEDIESHKAALRDNNSAATGLTGDKSRELKEKGNAFLKEGKYEEAVEAYSEAINIDDSNVILYSNRSLAYSKLELWPKAWSDGVKCTNIDPKFGKGWGRRALAEHKLGKYSESKTSYNKGLVLEPDNQQLIQGLYAVQTEERHKLLGIPVPTSSPSPTPSPSPAPVSDSKPTEVKKVENKAETEVKKEQKGDKENDKKEEKIEGGKPDTKEKKDTPSLVAGEKPSKTDGEEIIDEDGTYFYTLLGVEKGASDAEIKKGYFKMARIYHPDKSSDPQAEEIFKNVSEAYDILSNPEKKSIYDQFGLAAVRNSEAAGEMDPAMMFRMLFGAGAFDHIFGDIGKAFSVDEDATEEQIYQMQMEQTSLLLGELNKRLDLNVSGKDKLFKSLNDEISDLCDSPGGPTLLGLTAYVYMQEGKKNMGRAFGLEGFFAEVAEKGHNVKQTFTAISSAMQLQKMSEQAERDGEMDDEATMRMMNKGLNFLWIMGKMSIEKTLRDVCRMLWGTTDKKQKKKVATALFKLGELYDKHAKAAKKRDRLAGKGDTPFANLGRDGGEGAASPRSPNT